MVEAQATNRAIDEALKDEEGLASKWNRLAALPPIVPISA